MTFPKRLKSGSCLSSLVIFSGCSLVSIISIIFLDTKRILGITVPIFAALSTASGLLIGWASLLNDGPLKERYKIGTWYLVSGVMNFSGATLALLFGWYVNNEITFSHYWFWNLFDLIGWTLNFIATVGFILVSAVLFYFSWLGIGMSITQIQEWLYPLKISYDDSPSSSEEAKKENVLEADNDTDSVKS